MIIFSDKIHFSIFIDVEKLHQHTQSTTSIQISCMAQRKYNKKFWNINEKSMKNDLPRQLTTG